MIGVVGSTFTKIFGSRNERMVRSYTRRVAQINAQEPQTRQLTDAQLKEKTQELRDRLSKGERMAELLPEALAVAREAMDRAVGIRNIFNPEHKFDPQRLPPEVRGKYEQVFQQAQTTQPANVLGSGTVTAPGWQQVDIPVEIYEAVRALYPESRPPFRARPFDVQLIGGMVLSEGKIAEMKTGEGKTIVAPLACYLACLENLKCYVVTVNDYLVQRDRDWVFPFYYHLGLHVGAIHPYHMQHPAAKMQAYQCDVVYGTNSEFGFDYLRDNMKLTVSEQCQRRRDFCIIDEVDSILIDEARTPLIISGPAHEDSPRYTLADDIARHLMMKQKAWNDADTNVKRCQMRVKGLEGDIRNARDKDKIIRLREELELAEKELPGLEAGRYRHVQYYEVELEKKASHLTHEGVAEAQKQANIGSFYVGANMDFPHLLENALRAHAVYQRDRDYVVQNGEVIIVDEFTGRLMIGRQWSDGLHQAVEAKEKVKIKQETQTLATVTIQNYFKLFKRLAGMTGTAITEATEFNEIYKLDVVCIPTNVTVIRQDRPDVIYISEKDKWDAVLEEIKRVHDVGRPVLVGTTSVENSEMLSWLLTRKYGIKHEVLNAKQHEREAQIVAHAGELGAVMIATNMAGRGTDIRLQSIERAAVVHHWQLRNLLPREAKAEDADESLTNKAYRHLAVAQLGLKPKDVETMSDGELRLALLRHWVAEHTWNDAKKAQEMAAEQCAQELDKSFGFMLHKLRVFQHVEEMGGLHIVGTERHEARRIDNQLRGRAGRQGDRGSSRFFVALEDDLMKLFAGPKVLAILSKLGMKEGDALESRMVTKRIEAAQRKVEERNYEIRKNLLEYDEVMEHQRNAFYGIRQTVLEGRDTAEIIFNYIGDSIEDACERYLDKEYVATQAAEWSRQTLDVSIEPGKLKLDDLEELQTIVRAEARAEARQVVEITIGEYMSNDVPPEDWDLRSLSSWAMSRFSVDLKQNQLRQMNVDEVVNQLTEAAAQQIDKKDLSGLVKFLDPLYAQKDLAEWVQQKFGVTVAAEDLTAKQGERLTEYRQRITQLIFDKAVEAYRRREISYPIEFALEMVAHAAQQNQQWAAQQLVAWANQRYDMDWTVETVQGRPINDIYQQLIVASQLWNSNGKVDALVDRVLGEQGEDSTKLAEWAQKRLGQPTEVHELSGLGRAELQQKLSGKVRAMLRHELSQLERFVLLQILDTAWKDHLYAMDQLKDSVGLRGYAERDPRIEYKREGSRQFQEMQRVVRDRVTELIFRAKLTPNVQARSVYTEQKAEHVEAGSVLAARAAAQQGTEDQRRDMDAAQRAGAEQQFRSRKERRAAESAGGHEAERPAAQQQRQTFKRRRGK